MDGVKLFWSGGGIIIVYMVNQPFKLSRLPAMVFTPQTTRDYYYYFNDEPLVYHKQGRVWHPPAGTLGIVNTLI